MNRIFELIDRLCPDGVEFKALGDVVSNLDAQRRPVTRSDRRTGKYPYYGANGVQDYVDDFILDGTYLLIGEDGSVLQEDGSPVLNWATGKIWVNNHAHVLIARQESVSLRFLFFYLQTVDISALTTGSTQPKLNQGNLNRIPVPVPPIRVQEEIVGILDTYKALEGELEGELEAELKARRRQYEYYRDSLLNLAEANIPWRTIGDLGSLFGGLTGKSKADFADGNARFVSYVNIFCNIAVDMSASDRVQIRPLERQRVLQRGDILFTGSSESSEEVCMSSVVTRNPDGPLYLNSFSIGYRLNEPGVMDPEFAKHLFRSSGIRAQLVKTASGVTRFNVSKARLARVRVPIPPLETQRRIAAALDAFDALVNDLSVGLPAELTARRKQYEYYRDKLLTFEELA